MARGQSRCSVARHAGLLGPTAAWLGTNPCRPRSPPFQDAGTGLSIWGSRSRRNRQYPTPDHPSIRQSGRSSRQIPSRGTGREQQSCSSEFVADSHLFNAGGGRLVLQGWFSLRQFRKNAERSADRNASFKTHVSCGTAGHALWRRPIASRPLCAVKAPWELGDGRCRGLCGTDGAL